LRETPRGCGVGSGVAGWGYAFAGATAVSRKFHEPTRLATPASRAFHAWLACPSPHIPEDARPSRGRIAPTGTKAGTSAR
jgi:hypothetical protein